MVIRIIIWFLILTSPAFAARTVQVQAWGELGLATGGNVTRYVPPAGSTSQSATQSQRQILSAISGVIQGLSCNVDADLGTSGQTVTFTVMLEGSASSISCLRSGNNTPGTCTDNDFATISAGDSMAIRTVNGGIAIGAANASCSTRLIPDVAGQQSYGGVTSAPVATSSIYFNFVSSNQNATEIGAEIPWAMAGTFSHLYVETDTAPDNGGGTQQWQFDFRVNGADCGITTTLSEAETTDNDTSNTCTVAAGDTVTMEITDSGTPVAANLRMAIRFIPTNPNNYGDFVMAVTNDLDAISTASTEYVGIDSTEAWGAEADVNQVSRDMIFKGMYVVLDGSPGSGKSYAFAVRDDAGNIGTTITVSDAEEGDGAVGDFVEIADGSMMAISATPSGTPTARGANIGVLMHYQPRRQW